ncbi:hypothetical protein AMEX_G5113 [Astyanax mexicanus]|uniref:NID domain-containing protein n=1 Tax=Astyanax mexicanus TaxID=7994 RepID=A0A8T2M4M7_ASTMX|nr:hypothetical protein AMEX_G5113 [Astyanax mexicanus]
MELMVIKVCGIPDVQNGNQMLDQLKIHFQRRSNNGADVLTVLPAPASDQAYVVFETKEVPGVLQCNHVLEVDRRFYPIYVHEAQQSEVDMTVETNLILTKFSNPQDVQSQLESNGFKITKNGSDLHLKGSFLSLMLLRKQLARLQAQDAFHKRTSSSGLFNGYSSASISQMEASSNHDHVISNGVHTGRRRPMVDGPSPLLAVSPASPNLPQSAEYGDPGSDGSPRSPHSYDYDSYSKSPSTKPKQASLLVDKDVLDYAFKYEEDVFKKIEKLGEMSVVDDKEVSTVTFSGKNCEKAKQKLETCIKKITPHLRTQEIDLNNYDPGQQEKIYRRIQLYEDKMPGVIIKQYNETVKLIGSSTKSFEMKQKLLEHINLPSTQRERGRSLERKSTQRSSSLPRQYKHKEWGTDQGRSAEPKYSATPTNYQEELQSRQAQGRSNEPQSRRRSNSESRDKNKAGRWKPNQHEDVPSPNRDEKRITKKSVPTIKQSMMDITKKLNPKRWKK